MTLAPDSTDHVGTDPATVAPDPVATVLDAAAAAAVEYLAGILNRRVSPDPDALDAIAGFDIELPDGPRNPADVVTQLHRLGSPATTASAGGRFFGLVVGGTLPAALGAGRVKRSDVAHRMCAGTDHRRLDHRSARATPRVARQLRDGRDYGQLPRSGRRA